MPKQYFPKVKEAREILASKAVELTNMYLLIAQRALANNDFKEAREAVQFLLEHMPTDVDGISLIDGSIDKTKQALPPAPPMINIGFTLGGTKPKQIEAQTVDAEVVKKKEDE